MSTNEVSQGLIVHDADPKPTILASTQTYGGLVPRNLEELWRIATWIAKSGMAPKSLNTPEAISVAIQMGLEVGMKVMQSVQNIAVINGRPAIWGDAALALCRASGEMEEFEEWFEGEQFTDKWTAHCLVKRRGDKKPTTVKFSYADAKRAKLVPAHADSPWTKYPARMLQMRARSWPLRDKFADVLKGLQVREEASDIVMMRPTANGGYEASAEKISGKEALKEKLRKKAEPEESIPAQTNEDAPKTHDPDSEASGWQEGDFFDYTLVDETPEPETEEVKEEAKTIQLDAMAREYEIYEAFKNLKTPGFVDWLRVNVANRGTWSLFIQHEVEKKCKNLFGNTLSECVQNLDKLTRASSPAAPATPTPKQPPAPYTSTKATLQEKIIQIKDLLARDYDEIAVHTVQEWMDASWECNLGPLLNRVTDKIADEILNDLSDPPRSSLTHFARL